MPREGLSRNRLAAVVLIHIMNLDINPDPVQIGNFEQLLPGGAGAMRDFG
jgi:hypothetical protein